MNDRRQLPELLAAVEQRLLQARDGNPEALLDDGALADASALLHAASAAKPGVLDVHPATLLALFHWFRYQALPAGENALDLYEALDYFALLMDAVPEIAPAPARLLTAGGRNGPAARAVRAVKEITRVGDREDTQALDAAIDALSAAIAALPSGHPIRADMQASLGVGYGWRYKHHGEIGDLERSITAIRQARTMQPPPTDIRVLLTSLGSVLLQRFQRLGTPADLDESIRALREAAKAPAVTPGSGAATLTNLSLALQARAEHIGGSVDQTGAVTAARQAVQTSGADGAAQPLLYNNLVMVLSAEFRRAGDTALLDEAAEAGRQAIALTPASHPERPLILRNLAAVLRARAEQDSDAAGADLDEAVEAAREAMLTTPTGSAAAARIAVGLLLALRVRHRRTDDGADIDEAVYVGRRCVELLPPGHPDLAMALLDLGAVLTDRANRTGDRRDREESINRWSTAAGSATAPAVHRLRAAHYAAQAIARLHRPQSASRAYATALDLLELTTWRGIGRADQLRLLQVETAGLASDAASTAIADGDPAAAVARLEQGRGVLWSQLLATRTDLTRLEQADADLARRMSACRAGLDQLGVVELENR
ncbi:hypothetical protein [Catellatospora sp. NPDC049609]|uniref:hypothetical protein n=1 Tax=Catellatospora sp. NPDC049609 TaxID=3155505 RepID=UPI00343BF50A